MENKYKFGFMILNYLTYDYTIALVKSIASQIWFDDIKLYVVDNGSGDEIVAKLKEIQKDIDFQLLRSPTNLGVARGYNIGIKQARMDGHDFVICINNDSLLSKQDQFLTHIIDTYQSDKKIATIVANAQDEEGNYIVPTRKQPLSFVEKSKLKLFHLTGFDRIYYFIRVYVLFGFLDWISRKIQRSAPQLKKHGINGYFYSSSAALLVFTPTFFQYFDGMDDNSFLYAEESILASMLYEKDLKLYVLGSICITHLGSKTLNLLNKSRHDKVKFGLKHTFNSRRYWVKRYL